MPDSTLTNRLVEAAAEAMHDLEYPAWSATAHPDSNRWSWRGDGHLGVSGETEHYDEYRRAAAVAVAAVLALLADAVEAERAVALVYGEFVNSDYNYGITVASSLIRSAVPEAGGPA